MSTHGKENWCKELCSLVNVWDCIVVSNDDILFPRVRQVWKTVPVAAKIWFASVHERPRVPVF